MKPAQKVWIVLRSHYAEGDEVRKVFDTEENAGLWVARQKKPTDFEVEEWSVSEDGTQVDQEMPQ